MVNGFHDASLFSRRQTSCCCDTHVHPFLSLPLWGDSTEGIVYLQVLDGPTLTLSCSMSHLARARHSRKGCLRTALDGVNTKTTQGVVKVSGEHPVCDC